MQTFEYAKMEKHWKRRGLNLCLCVSRPLAMAETSIITESSKPQELWSVDLDVLSLDKVQEEPASSVSWLVRFPVFFNTSSIVGCRNFPSRCELRVFEIFFCFLLLTWEALSGTLFCSSFFSPHPGRVDWLKSEDPLCSTWTWSSGRNWGQHLME